MKQKTFEERYQPYWQKLGIQLGLSKSDEPISWRTFPLLYRQICHHLALAKDRQYTPYLQEQLNNLVLQGHQHLYSSHNRLTLFSHWLKFLVYDFPNQVRQEKNFIAISSLLFFGPLLVIIFSIYYFSDFVYYILDSRTLMELEVMYNPNSSLIGRDRKADNDFLMFGYYIYNNVSIDFQTFASGILLGIGSVFYLFFNGVYIGAIFGYLIKIGYDQPLFSFVSGHSAFELTAIVFSGAIGLKLGLSLLSPGRLSRLEALKQAAKHSIPIMYGVIIMSVMAAFIEAFWSSNGLIPPHSKYLVGGLLWLLVLFYFGFVGRHRET